MKIVFILILLFCTPFIFVETGTEHIKAISDWEETTELAESNCESLLEEKRLDFINELEDEGGEEIGNVLYPNDIEYNEDKKLYKCSCSEDIHWKKEDKTKIQHSGLSDLYAITNTQTNYVSNSIEEILTENILSIKPYKAHRSKIKIKFINLEIYDSELTLYPLEKDWISLEEKHESFILENCTSFENQKSGSMEISVKQGKEIEFSKTIETTAEVKGDLKFGNKTGGGGTFGASYTKNVTLKNTRSYSYTSEKTIIQNYKYSVRPQTKVLGNFTWQQYKARRPFKGNVLIEGQVQITSRQSLSNLIFKGDLEKIVFLLGNKKLSVILPNSRSFPMEGYLNNVEFTEIKEIFKEAKCE